jgi:hypothetical protein
MLPTPPSRMMNHPGGTFAYASTQLWRGGDSGQSRYAITPPVSLRDTISACSRRRRSQAVVLVPQDVRPGLGERVPNLSVTRAHSWLSRERQ